MFGKKFETLQAQLTALTTALATAGLDATALLADPAAYAATLRTPATPDVAPTAATQEASAASVASQAAMISTLQAETAALTEGLKLAGITLPAAPKAADLQAAIAAAIETAAIKKAVAQVAASGHEPLPVANNGADAAVPETLDEIRAQIAATTDSVKKGKLAAKAEKLRWAGKN